MRVPKTLTQGQVEALLNAPDVGTAQGLRDRAMLELMYASGLRVSEPLNLRIKDVDLRESKLYIYQAKGGKGRVVLLPACMTRALEQQMTVALHVAQQDHARL